VGRKKKKKEGDLCQESLAYRRREERTKVLEKKKPVRVV